MQFNDFFTASLSFQVSGPTFPTGKQPILSDADRSITYWLQSIPPWIYFHHEGSATSNYKNASLFDKYYVKSFLKLLIKCNVLTSTVNSHVAKRHLRERKSRLSLEISILTTFQSAEVCINPWLDTYVSIGPVTSHRRHSALSTL